MSTTWLPDWRKIQNYPNVRQETRRVWAWEFLRRNPKFEEDQAKAEQSFNEIQRQQAMPQADWQEVDSARFIENTNRVNAFIAKYALNNSEFDPARVRPSSPYHDEMFLPESYWSTSPPYCMTVIPPAPPCNGQTEEGAPSAVPMPEAPAGTETTVETVVGGEIFGGRNNLVTSKKSMITLLHDGEVLVKFDISYPIKAQIDAITTILSKRQSLLKKLGILNEVNPRTTESLLQNYLIVFDAYRDTEQKFQDNSYINITTKVAELLFCKKSGQATKSQRDRVENHYQAAKVLVEGNWEKLLRDPSDQNPSKATPAELYPIHQTTPAS